MKNTIAITNQKGGVAKSTTAQALGEGLRAKGFRVLSVDMDPQGNLSFAMDADLMAERTVFDVLQHPQEIADVIQHTEQGDVLPANVLLAGVDRVLGIRKEEKLRQALEEVADQYDWIVIDTPPALGTLTNNALMAADRLIVPMVADIYSLQGIAQLLEQVREVQDARRREETNLRISGLLITRFSGRANIRKDIRESIEELAEDLGCSIYGPIREAAAIVDAQANRKSLHDFARKSTTIEDYDAFVEAFLQEG